MTELKNMFEQKHGDEQEIKEKMDKTYTTQRLHINSKDFQLKIVDADDWPYLFEEKFMMRHAQVLLSKDVLDSVTKGFGQKAAKVWRFMHTVDKVKDIVASVETACDEQGDSMPRVMGMIFVLSKYFDEDVNELVRQKQVMIKLWNKKCHNLI